MSILDWVLLAMIGGYLGWLIFRPKKKKCNGCCEGCDGCR